MDRCIWLPIMLQASCLIRFDLYPAASLPRKIIKKLNIPMILSRAWVTEEINKFFFQQLPYLEKPI